jgi:hypothetical protein
MFMSIHRPPRSALRRRRAFTVLETMLAVTLACVCGSIILPLMVQTTAIRKVAAQEQYGLAALSNVLNDLTVVSTEEIEARRQAWMTTCQSDWREMLPGAELTLELSEPVGDLGERTIVCRLVWHDRSGQPRRPLMLNGWRFEPQRGQP